MQITRRSMLTGKTNTMDLDITQNQLDRFNNGMLIQNAFPHLTPGEREFILNGITPEEWVEYFGDGSDDDDEEDYDYYDNEVEYNEHII